MPTALLPLHRTLAAALLVALPLATLGCGSSEGSTDKGGDTEERGGDASTTTPAGGDDGDTSAFCDGVVVFDQLRDESATIEPEVMDRFDELLADAPDEVADELGTLVDAFRVASETDLDDEEAFGEVMGLFLSPEVVDASEVVEAYVLGECDFDIDPDDSDDVDLDDLTADGSDDAADGTAGDDGDDPVGIDAFEAFLDEAGASAHPWRDDLVGTSISSANDSIDVTLDFPAGVTSDDAVDACTAAEDYFGPLADELAITVTVDGSDAASYDPATGCAAAP